MKWLYVVLLALTPVCSHAKWGARFDSLARATEAKYHLPRGTCYAFSFVESSWDSSAARVETGYFNAGSRYARQIDIEAAKFVGDSDRDRLVLERAQRSISYGLFQEMGENLREAGYTDPVIHPTVEEQFEYFGKFVSNLFRKYHTLARAASAYNTGGPNHSTGAYAREIVRVAQKYK